MFAARKFRFRADLALLLDCARGNEEVFEQIAFYAKFLSKAHAILQRSGPGGEEVSRLSAEFGEKLGETSSLIGVLTASRPGGAASEFAARYLVRSQEGVERLLGLLYELSWIKNYRIEHGAGM